MPGRSQPPPEVYQHLEGEIKDKEVTEYKILLLGSLDRSTVNTSSAACVDTDILKNI